MPKTKNKHLITYDPNEHPHNVYSPLTVLVDLPQAFCQVQPNASYLAAPINQSGHYSIRLSDGCRGTWKSDYTSKVTWA
jgi:hypothetical protein